MNDLWERWVRTRVPGHRASAWVCCASGAEVTKPRLAGVRICNRWKSRVGPTGKSIYKEQQVIFLVRVQSKPRPNTVGIGGQTYERVLARVRLVERSPHHPSFPSQPNKLELLAIRLHEHRASQQVIHELLCLVYGTQAELVAEESKEALLTDSAAQTCEVQVHDGRPPGQRVPAECFCQRALQVSCLAPRDDDNVSYALPSICAEVHLSLNIERELPMDRRCR